MGCVIGGRKVCGVVTSPSYIAGYEALRSMGLVKEEGEGEGGEREKVICDRVPEDGMRSDGETSDRTEEENSTAHVRESSSKLNALYLTPSLSLFLSRVSHSTFSPFLFISPSPIPPSLPLFPCVSHSPSSLFLFHFISPSLPPPSFPPPPLPLTGGDRVV